MQQLTYLLLIASMALPLHAGLELKITRTTHNNNQEISAHLGMEKHDKVPLTKHWTNFAKQVMGSYGAAYAIKILHTILARGNADLADCPLVRLLFCYIALSACDDAQQWLTHDSSFCATLIGTLFALATDSPVQLYRNIYWNAHRNTR